MASIKVNLLSVFITLMIVVMAVYGQAPANNAMASEAKLTLNQKVASVIKSDKDLQLNSIPGSSDYVPDTLTNFTESTPPIHQRQSHISNFVNLLLNNSAHANTTRSQANVFEATAPLNGSSQKDPLLVNAQSPNPFLSNVPGGMNPQIAMLMQNNPRLQMLARQNPIVAQQIMRNPALLRDPQIQRKCLLD